MLKLLIESSLINLNGIQKKVIKMIGENKNFYFIRYLIKLKSSNWKIMKILLNINILHEEKSREIIIIVLCKTI